MTKKILSIVITILTALLSTYNANAIISIDSVAISASTCTNNGSITVFATTTTGTLLYAVTSGPVTYPVQTSKVFASLQPGTYTIEVSNTSIEKYVISAVVAGNYQLPDFVPLVTAPDCPDNNTGSIDGNPTSSSGLLPYTWELIAPSAVVRPAQTDPVFNNLPQGQYTLRMTDACSNIQTKSVIVFAPPNTLTYFTNYVNITGCDSADAYIVLLASDNRPPYKVSYTVKGKTYTNDSAKFLNNGALQIILPATNVSYGDAFTNITITNACGVQVNIPIVSICSFIFSEFYSISPGPNCSSGLFTIFNLGILGACGNTVPKYPFTITIKDGITNTLVETKYYKDPYTSNFGSVAMQPGASYNITFTDSCNKQFTHTITTPVKQKYVDYSSNGQQTLLDSTAITYIYAHGFPSTGTTLTVTGGPTSAHSTKKGYVYSEDYIYPKTFIFQAQSDSSLICPIYNTFPGKYYYSITDSCGNVYIDSFTVAASEVADFYFKYDYTKGCAGESGLQYEFLHNTFSAFSVTDIITGTVIHSQSLANLQNPYSGVLNNLKATDYKMEIDYFGGGIDRSLNNILVDQFSALDTIHIFPYRNPALKSSSSILCNGNLSLVLTADSSRGIPPYQYEVISGPQTFPPQPANIFQLTQKGLYRIRLIDNCGNSTATDVTVDDLVFPPLSKIGNSCINGTAELTYGASTYFSYTWTRPGGSVFEGDTLTISPVTPGDTGVYTISRLTTINGCTSTQSTTYRLTAGAVDSFAVNVCPGQSYQFGNRTLTLTGIFRDTIRTSFCDSISIINLTVDDFKRDSSIVSICRGQVYLFGSKTLNQPGIYRDTLTSSTCDSISIVNLAVDNFKKDSIAISICAGQSYTFGNKILTQGGLYNDTLRTATCDSISVLWLTVNILPVINAIADKYSVAKGETVHLSVIPSNLDAYIWTSLNGLSNNSISDPSSIVNFSAFYSVIVTDANNCRSSDSLFIQLAVDSVILSCNKTAIYIPGAFTPNNDSKNDFFKISGINNISFREFNLVIFNRWGQKVFESNDPLKYWNGSYNGKPADQGNYVYSFRFICEDGRVTTQKGNIVLLR